jgi:uncharacterized membrane protein
MLAGHPVSAFLLANQGPFEFLITPVNGLVACLALLVSLIGVAVIVWGAYVAVVRLMAVETAVARGQAPKADASPGRLFLPSYFLPGLDFILAGLVVKMAVVPDWQQAVVLAGVVVVRTFLSLSLRWEALAEVGPSDAGPVAERQALPSAPPPQVSNRTTEERTLAGVDVG